MFIIACDKCHQTIAKFDFLASDICYFPAIEGKAKLFKQSTDEHVGYVICSQCSKGE